MENSILTYRRRIVKSALLRHLRKTGGNAIVIKLPKGGITTIELTEIVMDGLLSRFELLARREAGAKKGNETIKDVYYRSLDVVPHVRASTALLYLIECDKRWGLREGKYQFKNGEHVFEITQQLIESVLIKYVEEELIAHKPQERYIAVYQFYHSNDSQVRENGQSWFNQFLDDLFIDLAVRLRAGGELPVKPIVH
ncbi:hypothetical protein [Cronobacter sp. HA18006]|uniref:hypothetical protein n=1 Tax=Cronobacter sp. HA18006 TaxID=2715229 RepID=UPI001AA11BCA|nr:hypothetical protein [Cronobacter sp. HA18006]